MLFDVNTRFPTGNGIIAMTDDGIIVDRDLRDSTGDRWYWHVRVRAHSDAVIAVRTMRPGLLGRFGPAVSVDGGSYEWQVTAEHDRDEFTVEVHGGHTTCVCATLPYGPAELGAFRAATRREISWSRLTPSERGRPVPLLRVEPGPTGALLVLTARHHACEAMASYVLEGAVLRLLQTHREGRHRDLGLLAIPVMDIDGVVAGDEGKNRRPHDHNRDYGQSSRYASVRALRTMLAHETRVIVGLDLHTPGLRGSLEEKPYVVSSAESSDHHHASNLTDLLASEGAETLVFDESWNDPAGTGPRGCAAWMRSLPATRFAHTIEYPNAAVRGIPVTIERARAFGGRLIGSVLRLLT